MKEQEIDRYEWFVDMDGFELDVCPDEMEDSV